MANTFTEHAKVDKKVRAILEKHNIDLPKNATTKGSLNSQPDYIYCEVENDQFVPVMNRPIETFYYLLNGNVYAINRKKVRSLVEARDIKYKITKSKSSTGLLISPIDLIDLEAATIFAGTTNKA